jgi:RHS repeat-associated protein
MTLNASSRSWLFRLLLSILVLVALFFAADLLLPATATKQYAYDRQGRLIRRTTPNGCAIKYQYNKDGQISKVSYHRLGGLSQLAYPGWTSISFDYDPAGNRVAMKDGVGRTLSGYDEWNRLSQVTYADGKQISYEYDPWGQVRSITLPDASGVRYQYDLLGHLTDVDDGQTPVHYEYLGETNQMVRRLSNGISTIYQYSPEGQLRSIRHQKSDGALICSYRYEYDPEDHISLIEEATTQGAASTRYEYDLVGRLIKVWLPDGSAISFEYDVMGNRISQTDAGGTTRYSYNSEGRLVKAGRVTLTYDASGNLVSKEDGSQHTTYKYDEENRLVQVQTSSTTIRYVYDGDGRRLRRWTKGKDTRYLNDIGASIPQVIAEYDGSSQMSHYVLGQSRIARRDADGKVVYFLEDHLGSTRWIVDATGNVLARYAYSPFGVPTLVEGTPQAEFLFAGESWDQEAQLIYLRARYYDPQLGRFLTADPFPGSLQAPETLNQYAYANNDPVNRIDPLGMQFWPPPYRDPSLDTGKYLPPLSPRWLDGFPALNPPDLQRWTLDHQANSQAKPYTEPWLDRPLNWLGLITNSNWVGRNRSGGQFSYETDPRGQFLLGDTTVPGRHWLDRLAKWHDIQYWVDTHVTKGTEVEVPGPNGIEYYTSHGSVMGTNMTAFAHGLLRLSPLLNILGWPGDVEGRETKQTAHPVTLDAVRRFFDNPHNTGLYPPVGGGRSDMPSVGGVYLDQTAKLIGELGAIRGAVYDPPSGQLLLVGDKTTRLPAMKPEDLAAALRAVYSESPHEPGMTIDPDPQNPLAPDMRVIFFGHTENTRLGWVMFEADRVMKGYSIGRDNITKEKVACSVPYYQSVTAMGLADGQYNPGLWSRFWLVPEPVTARVSGDGHAILFNPVTIRVRTETMRWENGKLVPAGNIKDPHAEAFAAHFTQHYDDFAREHPVYAELKQVTQAVALAKWMKQQGIPVDWNFIRLFAGQPFPTPRTTPAADAEQTQTRTEGLSVHIRKSASFGGVEMNPQIKAREHSEAAQLQEDLVRAWTPARTQDQMSFVFKSQSRPYQAVALPVTHQPEVASFSVAETEPADCLALPADVSGLPGLTRYYNSSHNEPTEFGYAWSLQLPRLEFEAAGEKGEAQYVSVEGDPASRTLLQRFVLTNQFGVGQERFVNHFVDQNLRRIGFAPERSSATFRAIYPESDGIYRLICTNGEQILFDSRGRFRARLTAQSKALYDYDEADRLTSIEFSAAERQEHVQFEYDLKGRLVTIAAKEPRVTYEYDAAGNLSSVRCGGHVINYRYDDRRLLIEISVDGRLVVQNSYSATGRLLKQRDAALTEHQQIVANTPEGKIVTLTDGDNFIRRYYDKDLQLIKVEDGSRRVYHYLFDDHGQFIGVELTQPSGRQTKLLLPSDRRIILSVDPRGVKMEYRFGSNGQLADTLINNRTVATYHYGVRGELQEVSYEGGYAERYAYNAAGRLVQYRRLAPASEAQTTSVLNISYDQPGRAVSLSHPYWGQVRLVTEGRMITLTRGATSVTYRSDAAGRPLGVDGSNGLTISYSFQANGLLSSVEVSKGNRAGKIDLTQADSMISHSLLGGQTTYTYTPAGLLASVQDSYGARTCYTYDDKNRLRRIELANGRCLEYVYDERTGRLRQERAVVCRKVAGSHSAGQRRASQEPSLVLARAV